MNCFLGRVYDDKHATCISCIRAGEKTCKQVKKKRKAHDIHTVMAEGKWLMCTKDLRTPNDWTNKMYGKKIYRGERSAWEKQFRGIIHLWGKASGKRRLTVIRYVPDKRYLMKDKTNREGAMKPLEDALVNQGVLVDDRDEFLERADLRQEIDPARVGVAILVEDI
jgi:hypothetical protein